MLSSNCSQSGSEPDYSFLKSKCLNVLSLFIVNRTPVNSLDYIDSESLEDTSDSSWGCLEYIYFARPVEMKDLKFWRVWVTEFYKSDNLGWSFHNHK